MAASKSTKKTTAGKTAKAPSKRTPKEKDEGQLINDILRPAETEVSIDPNTGEIRQTVKESEEEKMEKQLWGKNPRRTRALSDLWYSDIKESLAKSGKKGEAKDMLLFNMTINAVLDLVMESVPEDAAMDVSYPLDTYIGMLLVNKKYGVDISEEMNKAISIVKREQYDTDDDFMRAVEDITDHWWSLGQPKLDMRNPSDAITEMLGKYGLNEE